MDRVQLRRDTKARWEQVNPVLLEGEVGYVTDDPNRYKIGNGVDDWNSLPYRGFDGTVVHETGTSETAVMSQKATTDAIANEAGIVRETLKSYSRYSKGTKEYFETENIILADGELGFETDTKRYKLGDGKKAWNDLDYFDRDVDDEPTAGSENLVKSGGVFRALEKEGEKINELEQEINGDKLVVITTEFSENYQYKELDTPIPSGTTIKNVSGMSIGLYDNITSKKQIGTNLAVGATQTINEEVNAIRALSGAGVSVIEYGGTSKGLRGDIELLGQELTDVNVSIDKILRNKIGIIEFKKDYVVSTEGSTKGKIVQSTGMRISNFLPLKNGKGFNISGSVINRLHFFSSDLEYLHSTEKLDGDNIPSDAAYCIIQFKDTDNPSGYENLRVDYCEDINTGWLANTWFKIKENVISGYTQEQLNSIKKVADAIPALSINKEGLYFALTNTTKSDIIIRDGNGVVARLIGDKKIEAEYIELVQDQIVFKAWIDFSMLNGIDTNYASSRLVQFTGKANNSIIYKKEENKVNEDATEVKSDFLKEHNISSSFTIDGLIISTDGKLYPSDTYKSTDFISTENILAIKATLPSTITAAGGAWYDESKEKLPINMSNNNDNFWQVVPNGAKYFRVSCPMDKQQSLVVLKVDDEHIDDKPTFMFKKATFVSPTTSKVVYSYKDFVDENGYNINTSRVELTGNGSGEQIKLGFGNRILNHKAVASVSVLDATSVISFGNRDHSLSNADDYIIDIEVRISGSSMKVYKKGQTDVLCTEKNLSFTLVAGDTYLIGYEKIDFGEVISDKSYGSTSFFIQHGEVKESLTFEYDNTKKYGEVRSDSISGCTGQPYFGLISGHVVYNNFFISSDYNPIAKAMIIGSSSIGGNTLCGTGEMHKKYAALLQDAIGKEGFVIVGKGGEEAGYEFIKFAPKLIDKYKPQYLIIALGINNTTYETYRTAVDYVIDYAINRSVIPVLTTITPFNNDARKTVRETINSWIRNSGYLYVDICKAVTDNNQESWKSGYVMSDDIHPSVVGHRAIYEAFVNELPEIFNL